MGWGPPHLSLPPPLPPFLPKISILCPYPSHSHLNWVIPDTIVAVNQGGPIGFWVKCLPLMSYLVWFNVIKT